MQGKYSRFCTDKLCVLKLVWNCNFLPGKDFFLLLHEMYIYVYIYIYTHTYIWKLHLSKTSIVCPSQDFFSRQNSGKACLYTCANLFSPLHGGVVMNVKRQLFDRHVTASNPKACNNKYWSAMNVKRQFCDRHVTGSNPKACNNRYWSAMNVKRQFCDRHVTGSNPKACNNSFWSAMNVKRHLLLDRHVTASNPRACNNKFMSSS